MPIALWIVLIVVVAAIPLVNYYFLERIRSFQEWQQQMNFISPLSWDKMLQNAVNDRRIPSSKAMEVFRSLVDQIFSSDTNSTYYMYCGLEKLQLSELHALYEFINQHLDTIFNEHELWKLNFYRAVVGEYHGKLAQAGSKDELNQVWNRIKSDPCNLGLDKNPDLKKMYDFRVKFGGILPPAI